MQSDFCILFCASNFSLVIIISYRTVEPFDCIFQNLVFSLLVFHNGSNRRESISLLVSNLCYNFVTSKSEFVLLTFNLYTLSSLSNPIGQWLHRTKKVGTKFFNHISLPGCYCRVVCLQR